MDAKSKAEFINKVAEGGIPCPSCGSLNKSDSNFCYACGANLKAAQATPAEPEPALEPIEAPEKQISDKTEVLKPIKAEEPVAEEPVAEEPAFGEPVADEPKEEEAPKSRNEREEELKAAFMPVQEEVVVEEEQPSIFAEGLPSWSVRPPMVAVRRKGL